MIHELNYAVTFPTNGLSLMGDFSLEPGVTAVRGPNGRGKTFGTIEMIRYGFFGKEALRGPASDYANLDMSMGWSLDGKRYRVERKPRKEQLFEGDSVIAVGAAAINAKVPELLGYGLDVFDVANCAIQKQSERLTRLRPAERKRLIDQVVGLDHIEEIERDCKDEARGLRREAEAIAANLREPTAPVQPTGYMPVVELQPIVEALREREQQRHTLVRMIGEYTRVRMPAEPTGAPRDDLSDTISALEAHEDERRVVDLRRATLSRIPEPTLSAGQIEAWEAHRAYAAELARRGPRPEMDEATAKGWLDQWDRYDDCERFSRDTVVCPSCEHRFAPGNAVTAPPEVAKPPFERNWLQGELLRNSRWAEPLVDVAEPGFEASPAQIDAARIALAKGAERAELATLPDMADKSAELTAARETLRAWDRYDVQLENYRAAQVRLTDANTQLAGLPDRSAELAEKSTDLELARRYEAELAAHLTARAEYDRQAATAADKARLADAYTDGGARLARARAKVKGFLAPAISRVSSALVHEMTGGHFSTIAVDDDMDILVDGQSAETLSGAQATAVNLALRLALSQVLVARRLPIFLGDEIDADADDVWAPAIVSAVASMRKHLQQVIIVSHKDVDADQVIEIA